MVSLGIVDCDSGWWKLRISETTYGDPNRLIVRGPKNVGPTFWAKVKRRAYSYVPSSLIPACSAANFHIFYCVPSSQVERATSPSLARLAVTLNNLNGLFWAS